MRALLGTDDLAGYVTGPNARLGLPDGLAAMGVDAATLARIAEHAERRPLDGNQRPPGHAGRLRADASCPWIDSRA
jgi:hypothetical protein